MSITSLAAEEVARTESQASMPKYTTTMNFTEASHIKTPPSTSQTDTWKTNASNALDSLARYIPTEAVTLYIAAFGAFTGLAAAKGSTTISITPSIMPVLLYWVFAALTPIIFMLIYIGKRRSAGLSFMPQAKRNWPWWKVSATTVAFLGWALAVPSAPYLSGTSGRVIALFIALFISTFLTLLEPICEPNPAPFA